MSSPSLEVHNTMHRLYADPRTSVSDGGSSQTTLRSVSPVPTRSTSPRASPQRKHVKAPKAAKPSPRGPRPFDHVICDIPEGALKAFNKGNDLYRQGKKEEALVEYDEACRLCPEECRFWQNKALVNYDLKRFVDAVHDADVSIVLNYHAYEGYLRKFLVYYETNQYKLAGAALVQGLAASNNAVELQFAMVGLKYALADYEKVVQLCRRLFVDLPENEYMYTLRVFQFYAGAMMNLFHFSWYNLAPFQESLGAVVATTTTNYKMDQNQFSKNRRLVKLHLKASLYPSYSMACSLEQQLPKLNIVALVQQGIMDFQHHDDIPSALESWGVAVVIARVLKRHRTESDVLFRMGTAYRVCGLYDKSIECHLRSISVLPHEASKAYSGLGNTYFVIGNYQRALEYHHKHLLTESEKGDRQGQGTAYNNIACVQYVLGRYKAAINFYDKYLEVCEEFHDIVGRGTVLNNLANCCLQSEMAAECRDYLNMALENHQTLYQVTVEKGPQSVTQRLVFLNQVRQTYRIAVELYLKCGMVEDALEWAERGKVRGALDNMTRVVHDQGQGDPTVRDMQDFATQNSVTIVSYSVLSRSQICIWVVQPFGGATKHSLVQWPRLFDLQMREFLRTSAEEIQTQVLVINSQNDIAHRRSTEVLTQLYEVLIRPIAVHLPDHPQDPIVIIPQGPLCYLPWPAFWNRSDSQFLIEQHALTLTSSAAVMLHNQRRRDEMRTARGGIRRAPSMRSQEFMAGTFYIRRREGGIQDFQHSIIFDPSLPHAKAEAHAVAGWLHAHVTNGATTARQKLLKSMKGSRFVHIVGRSTYAKDPRAPGDQGRKEGSDYQKEVHNSDVHGTIYFLRPEVLGAHDGGGDEDIRGTASPRFAFHAAELAMDPEKSLSLRKISKWVPDRCELLVLNTSGAWEDHDADAVDLVVLSRELHACGVGNCVLGQWPVQQRSACVTLWAAFYNERMKCEVEDDLALAICLQKAMLSTKAKYPHWLHWACWALYQ